MVISLLVQSETDCPKSQTHSRLSECDCGQVIPSRSGNSDGVFPLTGGTKFVSSIQDPKAWVVDALTVFWEDMDLYAFPPVSFLGKVISKLSDHLCKGVILIAPVWPNANVLGYPFVSQTSPI